MGSNRLLEVTAAVAAAREKWRYRGQTRPPFADPVGEGDESVWDFPRPPRVEPVPGVMRVEAPDTLLAETNRGVRVLETAGAPTYYFPPEDVQVIVPAERKGNVVARLRSPAPTGMPILVLAHLDVVDHLFLFSCGCIRQ